LPSLPLVTVVTVVYNGEPFLAECIESVMRQTYSNWEYRIIDNCSTDRTPEIAQAFASVDSRILYDRREDFVGVFASHNRGADAIGQEAAYVKFIEADDWLFPDCIERMVALAESEPTVGVVGSYRLNGTHVDLVNLPYTQSVEDGGTIVARSLVSPSLLIGSPTALLLRADLVRSRRPFYDESFRHADAEAGYWVLMRSNYGHVHQVLTYNRVHDAQDTKLSDRLAAYAPERLRALIRYGPQVLSKDDYDRELHAKLSAFVAYHRRLFVWYHTKGHCRREWRTGVVRERRDFHRRSVELMAAEAPDSPEVQRAARIVRALLH
jgi:glycosyltransferase involved in cell wall biosynthesis